MGGLKATHAISINGLIAMSIVPIVTATTAFAATNFDDIIVLMVFFANVNANLRRRHIVVGQYLGFTALLLLSLPGLLGGWLVPEQWLALLGLLPIGFGVAQLLQQDEEDTVQTVQETLTPPSQQKILWHPATYQVAAVTMANGGDNIGVYVPLFANHATPSGFGAIVGIFYLLVAVWCCVAAWLIRHRAIGSFFQRFGQKLVPFVLIGLGLGILVGKI